MSPSHERKYVMILAHVLIQLLNALLSKSFQRSILKRVGMYKGFKVDDDALELTLMICSFRKLMVV